MSTVDNLREEITRLERERPQSRLLQDFKRQLADWEEGQGRTAEQMYYAGNPVVPKSSAAADPMRPAADAIEAFWNKKHAQATAQPKKAQSAQSSTTTATKDESVL